MNLKLNLFFITAALLLFIGSNAQIAPAQGNKNSPSQNKTAPQAGCSPLTTAMVEKVLGQHISTAPAHEIMAMYGGAPGCGCTYRGQDVRIDFSIYNEASVADAKKAFYTYAVAADESKGKPAIGDSAYWVTDAKQEPYLYVLKGKVHFSIGMRLGNETKMKDLAGAVASAI